MSSIEKYSEIFKASLNIDVDKVNESLKYNEIDEWDSIGHMTLMAALEEEYKITLETDDIVDFSSYKKGIEILKKYNIENLGWYWNKETTIYQVFKESTNLTEAIFLKEILIKYQSYYEALHEAGQLWKHQNKER